MTVHSQLTSPRVIGLLCWSLLPSLTIWVGLYVIKSAAWAYALYHGIFLLPAIIIGRALWLKTLTWPRPRDVLIVLMAAILFCAVAVVAYEVAGRLVLSNAHVYELLKDVGLNKENLWIFGLYATVVNPLVEELYWRGVLLNALDNLRLPLKHFGIIWSSVTYALMHYLIFRLVMFPICTEIGIALLACYGALMALIYRRTGSIITTALAHGLLTDLTCVALLVDFYKTYPII